MASASTISLALSSPCAISPENISANSTIAAKIQIIAYRASRMNFSLFTVFSGLDFWGLGEKFHVMTYALLWISLTYQL